ncbi:MAG TPA: SDR family NAD(P)-dependent oxidoreductase [Pirellulaceae bacterium]|nr:SDR family NAD(P)-dependent oxidoreductase [Pirellulaceae bacterium]
MTSWHDKVVLITGGSAGLGQAIASAFAQQGAKVALVARDVAKLELAAQNIRQQGGTATPIAADIQRDEDAQSAVERTIATYGRLDVLVNCAGRSARGKLLETPLDEFRSLWELNFLATVRMTQVAAPHLLASRGHVVNIASLAAKSASRFLGGYATSKFPVAAFSQQLRLELADEGVHVLLVCPGPIAREQNEDRYAAQSANLPEAARRPGGGVKLKGIPPEKLAARIVRACERREVELIMPGKARYLFAIAQLWPSLGDYLLLKFTS